MAGVEGNIGKRGEGPVEAGGLGRVEGSQRFIGVQGGTDRLPVVRVTPLPRIDTPESNAVPVTGKDQRQYTVTASPGSPELLVSVKEQVLGLHERIFGPVFERNAADQADVLDDGPIHRRVLRDVQSDIARMLSDPDTHVVLLRHRDQIVGVTYAAPANLDQNQTYNVESNIPYDEYEEMQSQTATVDLTMIDEAHRGNAGWKPMVTQLFGSLSEAGYIYVTRTVRTDEGYDEKVAAHPGGEIIRDEYTRDTYHGGLRFLRVKLPRE